MRSARSKSPSRRRSSTIHSSGSKSVVIEENDDSQSDSDEDEEEKRIDQIHLYLIEQTLGKFSRYLLKYGDYADDFFTKQGRVKNPEIEDFEPMSISEILVNEYDFSEEDALSIEEFLLPMLKYDPKKRVSATRALKSTWLNN